MNKLVKLTLLILTWSIATVAGAVDIQCPSEIETQQEIKNNLQNWNALNEKTRYPLTSIRFSEGDPENIVWLVPDELKGDVIQIWNLPASSNGYWVSCGYNNTSIILAGKLQPKVSQCKVEYDKSYSPPIAVKYICK